MTKNAILIVDFANRERMAGVEADACNGAIARLRPVLMTTGATVPSFPLVLVTGAGAEARRYCRSGLRYVDRHLVHTG